MSDISSGQSATDLNLSKPKIWLALIAGVAVILFWVANWILGSRLPDDERGIFGDMFGAVNALFSGLALVGVIYAIIMQRYEISIARRDIAYTKQILDAQKTELEQQNLEQKKQSFESTFFQLLSLLSDITNEIYLIRNVNGKDLKIEGKDIFVELVDSMKKRKNNKKLDNISAANVYKNLYNYQNSKLGHYFRTVYNIIKYINNSNIEDKKFYTNIVRAQLSDSEVAILFYNGLSEHGREKFKPLMEKYGLLKNINESDVLESQLLDEYDERAFGGRTIVIKSTT